MEDAIIWYFTKHFFRSYQLNNIEFSDDHKEYFRDILPQDSGNIYKLLLNSHCKTLDIIKIAL